MLERVKTIWSRGLLLAAVLVPFTGHFGFISVQPVSRSHLLNLVTASIQWWGLIFLTWVAGVLFMTLAELAGQAHAYLSSSGFFTKPVKQAESRREEIIRIANIIRARGIGAEASSKDSNQVVPEQQANGLLPSFAAREGFALSELVKFGLIIGAAIVIAAFLVRDRFTVMSGRGGSVYVVDRFTGETRYCKYREFWQADLNQSRRAAAGEVKLFQTTEQPATTTEQQATGTGTGTSTGTGTNTQQ